jgi:spermidine synthase
MVKEKHMTLNDIGLKHDTDKSTRYHGYLDFYEKNLPSKPKRILEIGVMHGASLKMWRDYYPDAEVIGVDISEPIVINGVTTLKLDATTDEVKKLGKFDIIIDDGSHMTADQQKTFKLLFPKLKKGGVYIMEDIHTSFMQNYINSPITTYELLQKRDDVIYYQGKQEKTDSFTAIIKK